MIDRLSRVLPHLEHLPPEAQEEAATYIAALIEALESETFLPARKPQTRKRQSIQEPWRDPVGAWSNLPDTMLDELDHLRHDNPPSPPIDLS